MEGLILIAAALVCFAHFVWWAQDQQTPTAIPRRHPQYRLLVGGTAAVVVIFLIMPRADFALDQGCRPATTIAGLRAMTGPLFWSQQQVAIDREIKRELRSPQEDAEWKRLQAQFDADTEAFYRRNPAMRPTETAADRLRAQADAIEQREVEAFLERARQERLAILQRCKVEIADKGYK